MENSNPEPDYYQILINYPFEDVKSCTIPYLDTLISPDIREDDVEYQSLRAQILSDLVLYFIENPDTQDDERYMTQQKPSARSRTQQNELTKLKLQNALLSSINQDVDKDAFDRGVIRSALQHKIRPEQQISEAIVEMVAENAQLDAKNQELVTIIEDLENRLKQYE